MHTARVQATRKGPRFLGTALLAFLAVGTGLAASQAIDPFYLRLFEDGEAAFVAGDHAKAIKDLEVAVFGLSADRTRSARACVYLALSHSSLKNPEQSLRFMRRAVGLIGGAGPGSLGLAGGALNAYERLREKLPPETDAEGEEQARPAWETPKETAQAPIPRPVIDPARVKDLEGRLGKEPDNDILRLDLASLYIGRGDYRRAVKLMRDLLRRDPEEMMATYHLSRGLYFQKDHKKALEGFHKVIAPASAEKVTKDTILRSTIYTLLCLDALGQGRSVDSYLNYLTQNLPLTELKRLVTEEGLDKEWGLLGEGKE